MLNINVGKQLTAVVQGWTLLLITLLISAVTLRCARVALGRGATITLRRRATIIGLISLVVLRCGAVLNSYTIQLLGIRFLERHERLIYGYDA